MADFDQLLINKLAQTQSLEQAITIGVEPSMFASDDCRDLWLAMVDHFVAYKTSPSTLALNEMTLSIAPNFRPEIVQEPLEYVLDGFMGQARRRSAMIHVRNLAEAVDDPARASTIEDEFMAAAKDMSQMFVSSKVARFADVKSRIQLYHEQKWNGGSKGILYGIPEIDNVTNGIQPHEYITVSGWSGTGKSTLMMFILFNAWLQGKTPLLFSLEMESEAIMRKFDTLKTNFSYNNLKRFDLSDEEMEKWECSVEDIERAKSDIIVIDDVGRCTAERVYSEMQRYRPDIVAIDYITLMETTRKTNAHWEAVTQITRDLKMTARDLSIPIIGVAQTNAVSDGEFKGSNIAYSKSIVRDSDVMFDLFCDDEMRAANKMQLRLVKNRDGRALNTELLWDVEHMKFKPWRDSMAFMNSDLDKAMSVVNTLASEKEERSGLQG
jgi:replicative DNA helicase